MQRQAKLNKYEMRRVLDGTVLGHTSYDVEQKQQTDRNKVCVGCSCRKCSSVGFVSGPAGNTPAVG